MKTSKSTPVVFRGAVRSALEKINIEMLGIEQDLNGLNDLDLLFKLESIWPSLTQVKTFANFIKYDLGIGNERYIIIAIDASDIVLEALKMRLKEIGSLYLVTTAKTYHEGLALAKYYIGARSLAVVITDIFINSFDINSCEYEQKTSGLELIREIKKYERYFDQNVYCIAMSGHLDTESVFYKELMGEVKQVADIYIPRKSVNNMLTTLVRAKFGKG